MLTHPHVDHSGGMVADDGSRYFPNAQVYLTQADHDFWLDDARLGTRAEGSALIARKNLPPYRDRIVFIKDGQEIVPGVQAMATPGHTVGHTVFLITSDGKTICNIGDVAHHMILFEHPRIEVNFDTDSKQGCTRASGCFDMLAAQRIPLLGFHMPWPGHRPPCQTRRRIPLCAVADATGAVNLLRQQSLMLVFAPSPCKGEGKAVCQRGITGEGQTLSHSELLLIPSCPLPAGRGRSNDRRAF